VLDRSWRGSMLVECVNGLLRPILRNRQHTDQGCLELFRFLHNVHIFERGKRANWSPAQLVGIDVPDDVLTLLGLDPKVEEAALIGFSKLLQPLTHCRIAHLPSSLICTSLRLWFPTTLPCP
jgi:hypothetical protein